MERLDCPGAGTQQRAVVLDQLCEGLTAQASR